MPNRNEEEDIIARLQNLTIHQRRIIREIIEELEGNTPPSAERETQDQQGTAAPIREARDSTLGPNSGIRRLARQPNFAFISSDGTALALGDRVRILTTRRTGRAGDIAVITQFNRSYVAIKLLRNDSPTQRASFNLVFIE